MTFLELINKAILVCGESLVAKTAGVRTPVIRAWAMGVGPHPVAVNFYYEKIRPLVDDKDE